MKRKLLISTVASSLVLGTVAGIPYSAKGLQDLFGATVAQAAEESLPGSVTEWLQEVIAAFNQLTPQEKANVREVWSELGEINGDDNNLEIVEPFVSIVNANNGDAEDVSEEEALIALASLAQLTFTSNEDQLRQNLDHFRDNPDIRAFFNKIGEPAGISLDGEGGIVNADFVAFAEAFTEALIDNVSLSNVLLYLKAEKTDGEVAQLKAAFRADLEETIADLIANEDLKVSTVLQHYASNPDAEAALTDALADAYFGLAEVADPNFSGHAALVKGVVRSKATGHFTNVTHEGRRITPRLVIMNVEVPAALIRWETDNANVTYNSTTRQLVLANSVPANREITFTASAYDVQFDQLLYSGSVTMEYVRDDDDDDDGSGTPNPPQQTPVTQAPPTVEQARNQVAQAVANVREQLQQATPEQRREIARQLVQQVQQTLNSVARVDLTSAVTVTEDGATVSVDSAAVMAQIQLLQQQAQEFSAMLGELGVEEELELNITLDVGNVGATSVDVPLSQDVLQQASAAGVTTLTVKANGVAIGFSPDEFDETVSLSIEELPEDVADEATNLPVASKVYSFTIATEDGEVEQFRTPVLVGFPVSTQGVDPELLTIAKIVNGQLIIYGGTVANGAIQASRTSFSDYVVVENKVVFTDTNDVKAWAGRQIEVVAAKGIIEGRGEGQYDPNARVTRAEFAKMIAKAVGIDGVIASENFSDVGAEDWFQPYVAAVQEWGIVNGRSATEFAPNEPITRAEMATMIARALQQVKGFDGPVDAQASLNAFADAASIHASLQSGVAFAVDNEIVIGFEDGSFGPNEYTTRAQAAVMIYRALNAQ